MILILSSRADDHVRRVARALDERGKSYAVFDPALFPTRARMSASFGPGHVKRAISFDDRSVSLGDVHAAWYRRPGPPAARVVDPNLKEWVEREARALVDGIWEGLGCRWIPGPPAVALRAGRKSYHLGVAEEIGFRVPRTVFTNDPAAVLEFYEECRGDVVVKTLTGTHLRVAGAMYVPFTAPVRRRDVWSYRDARHGPAILQEYVPKRVEVRVNVFGGRVLAAEIDSQQSPWTRHDWRRNDLALTPHRPHRLPDDVQRLCVRYVRALGLCAGHIDLILTPSGEYVFLEINPHGAWTWLEDRAGLPLTEALVDLLLADDG